MEHIMLVFGLRQLLGDRSTFTTWCLWKKTLEGFVGGRSQTRGIIQQPDALIVN